MATQDNEEAREAVLAMARRVALLHMSYARTLVDALGEEQGKELICKAIWAYGTRIGERTRARVEALGHAPTPEAYGLGSDLSPLAFPTERVVVEGEARSRARSCVLAEVWREYGEEEVGSLYCLVDPAKMQAYNPAWTMVHTQKIPDGDPCCDIATRPTKASDEPGSPLASTARL
jgi:hypothetical protein